MRPNVFHISAMLVAANAVDVTQLMALIPDPPATLISNPQPLGNDAFWQEAVNFDAKNGVAAQENRSFYNVIAWAQTREMCSNSDKPDPISSASVVSQGLQAVSLYPADLNQAQAADPAKSIVTISTAPEQTINSFGISGAWWPNDLNFFPPTEQQKLSSLLFSESGLYVSGYRYNVGASGDKDNTTVNPALRGVQSFMKSDGTYDWTRDGPGVYYLNAAVDAKVSSITFFSNAQPAALTSSLTPCGTKLDSSSVAKYVAYIEKVLAYWADKGINIEYISPINEPDNDFSSCNQEGMAVDTTVRTEVFTQLRAALAASTSVGAKKVKILGDETSQVTQQALKEYLGSTKFFSTTKSWLPDTLEGPYIDAIAIHNYDFPDDTALRNYRQLVINATAATTKKGQPPPIKMTEVSSYSSARDISKPWGKTGPKIMESEYDPSIDNALDMARMIWQWMTLVNAESFDWWTAVSYQMPCSPATDATCTQYKSGAGWNDALVYIDPSYATNKNYQFYLPKRYWVFKHFTAYHRPGAVRYDIPNSVLPYGTVAMASQGTDKIWGTTFVNRNDTAQTITLKLPVTGAKILGMEQTTDKDDWLTTAPLPTIAKDDSVIISLPARGVLSLQFTAQPQTPQAAVAGRSVDQLQQRDGILGNEIVEHKVIPKPGSPLAPEAVQKRDILGDHAVERKMDPKPGSALAPEAVQQRDILIGDEVVERKMEPKPRSHRSRDSRRRV